VLALAGVTLPLVVLAGLVERELRSSPSAALMAGRDDRGRLASVVREVAPLALALLLVSVYTRVQVVFVNAAEDALGVAEYLLAWQVVEQIVVVGAIAGATLLPFFADRARERALHGDPLTQTVMVALGAVGTLLAAGLILTARPVMLLLGSERLADGARFLVLLAPMGSALFIAMTLSYAYAAMGLAGRYLRFNLAGLVVALALNATLTLSQGAEAAARVTWVTEFFVVSLALAPVWRSGAAGRATIARLAGLGALSVAAAEAAHADVLAPALGAALLAIAVVPLGGPALRELVATRLLRRAG
jgi:O-antigen/teichoic acid export membrane protein